MQLSDSQILLVWCSWISCLLRIASYDWFGIWSVKPCSWAMALKWWDWFLWWIYNKNHLFPFYTRTHTILIYTQFFHAESQAPEVLLSTSLTVRSLPSLPSTPVHQLWQSTTTSCASPRSPSQSLYSQPLGKPSCRPARNLFPNCGNWITDLTKGLHSYFCVFRKGERKDKLQISQVKILTVSSSVSNNIHNVTSLM